MHTVHGIAMLITSSDLSSTIMLCFLIFASLVNKNTLRFKSIIIIICMGGGS